jgi:hypothetical protein
MLLEGCALGVRPDPELWREVRRLSAALLTGLLAGVLPGLPGCALAGLPGWLEPGAPVCGWVVDPPESATAIALPVLTRRPLNSTHTPAAKRICDRTTISLPCQPKDRSSAVQRRKFTHEFDVPVSRSTP